MRTELRKRYHARTGMRLVHSALLACAVIGTAWSQTAIDVEVSTSSETAPPSFRIAGTPAPGSAEESASRIVPAPGTSLRTTEASEFPSVDEQAQPPSVSLTGDQLQVGAADTTERLAIESAADLLTKLRIVAPRRTDAGEREIDETTPTELFDDAKLVELLGQNPTVIYQVIYRATPIPDPMIVPWVRNAVVLKERFDEAIQLLAENKIEQGREALLDIETQFPETEYAVQAREIRNRLQELTTPQAPQATAATARATPTPAPLQINVDPNVRISTVIIDAQNTEENRVMINGRVYAVGDVIRDFPNHKVTAITEDTVTLEVEVSGQTKEFAVPVREARAKR
jgi:hypothetical protein